MASFETLLARTQAKHSARNITASIFEHSGQAVRSNIASLIGDGAYSKNRMPGLMKTGFYANGARWWGCLNTNERKDIAPSATLVYGVGDSITLAKHVEHGLHMHVLDQKGCGGVFLLQRIAGRGGPMAGGPYKIGVRFIVHEEDGSYLNGYVEFGTIPKTTPHFKKPVSMDSNQHSVKSIFETKQCSQITHDDDDDDDKVVGAASAQSVRNMKRKMIFEDSSEDEDE